MLFHHPKAGGARRAARRLAADALLLSVAAAGGAPATGRVYRVSYQSFAKPAEGADPANVVASIKATPGMRAQLLPPERGAAWRERPDDVPVSEWLSLVAVRTGLHVDFLLFRFEDDDGTVAFAAQRPSRVRQVQYWYSVPPGPEQIPINAIRETATDFLFRDGSKAAPASRPRLRLTVEPWKEVESGRGDLLDSGLSGGPASIDPGALAGLEALAFAAAFEAGWQPSVAEGGAAVTLRLREELSLFYSLQLTIRKDGKDLERARRQIPREDIYAYLVRVFRHMAASGRIRDFAFLGSPRALPLAWSEGAVVVADGLALKFADPGTGALRWSVQAGDKETPLYAACGDATDPRICRLDKRVAAFDLRKGASSVLAAADPASESQVSVSGDWAAVADGRTLKVFRAGSPAWTFEHATALAWPAFLGERLVAGDADGALLCFDPASKKTAWQKALDGVLACRPVVLDGKLLAATQRRLVALDPGSGRDLWSRDLDDVPLAPPVATADGILLATRRNTIVVLDAATGKEKARAAWPTWLTGLTAFTDGGRSLAACADLRKRVTFLRTSDLSPIGDTALAARLRPFLRYAADAPTRMVQEQDASESAGADLSNGLETRSPALLCADEDGFLYALEIPKP